MKKPTRGLTAGMVQPSTDSEGTALAPVKRHVPMTKLGILVHPEAVRQFDLLKAELKSTNRRDIGIRLIGEAFNLLFEKYGKPTVSLDE